MGLNKHELATIVKANPDNFSVSITSTDDGGWRAIVTLPQTGASHDVLTARGAMKSWRKLDDAIIYMQSICPDCKAIAITIGGWTFIRQLTF